MAQVHDTLKYASPMERAALKHVVFENIKRFPDNNENRLDIFLSQDMIDRAEEIVQLRAAHASPIADQGEPSTLRAEPAMQEADSAMEDAEPATEEAGPVTPVRQSSVTQVAESATGNNEDEEDEDIMEQGHEQATDDVEGAEQAAEEEGDEQAADSAKDDPDYRDDEQASEEDDDERVADKVKDEPDSDDDDRPSVRTIDTEESDNQPGSSSGPGPATRQSRTQSARPDNTSSRAIISADRQKLEDACKAIGWDLGTGEDPEHALVTGSVREPHRVVESTIPIKPQQTVAQVIELRKKFEAALEDIRWEGTRQGPKAWQRLHPWSIQILSELFFIDFVGPGFFVQVNAVINAVHKPVEDDQISRVNVIQAEQYVSKHQGPLPVAVGQLVTDFAAYTRMHAAQDAYTEYFKITKEAGMIKHYQAFVDSVENGDDIARQFLTNHQGHPPGGKPGVGIRTEVKQCIADIFKTTPARASGYVNKAGPLLPFMKAYGDGVLLLMKKGMVST